MWNNRSDNLISIFDPNNANRLEEPMSDLHETKERIMETAIELFAGRGFRGTSIRDIAGAVDMSISNIYHYFGNKEGLLLAILGRSSQEITEKLQLLERQKIDPLEKFKMILAEHLRLAGVRTREAKIFSLDEEHLSPEGQEINLKYQRDILNIYRQTLKEMQQEGLVRFRSLTVLAFNVLGAINWQLRWYRPDGPLSMDEVVEEIGAFVLHGVLGEGTVNSAEKRDRE